MSHIAHLLPHPVIKPDGNDYKEECTFEIKMNSVERIDNKIRISLSLNLKSNTVSNLIKNGDAEFCLISKCTETNKRDIYQTDESEIRWELPASDYARDLTIAPYVATTKRIMMTHSDEHDEEFGLLLPEGVNLPAGAILAVGNYCKILLYKIPKLQAAIKLTKNNPIDDGIYYIDTDGDYIEIQVNEKTYEMVETIINHNHSDVLYPSIYAAAVERAIRDMKENEGKKWTEALRKSLENKGIDPDEPDFADHANKYAQELLEGPMKRLGVILRTEQDE